MRDQFSSILKGTFRLSNKQNINGPKSLNSRGACSSMLNVTDSSDIANRTFYMPKKSSMLEEVNHSYNGNLLDD